MIGQKHHERGEQVTDPSTGCAVRRLTDLEAHCHHPYFYCRAFTPDGRHVVYVSHRTGRAAAYLLELASGESIQLTDGDHLGEFMLSLSPDGRALFYPQGSELHRLTIATGEDQVVWTQRPPWDGQGMNPSYNDSYTQALIVQMHRDDVVRDREGWDVFEPQWRKRPRCRLVLVDLVRGVERIVREEACWLGHPQIRPHDPDTLMFCHEGPWHLVDARIWLINADGTNCRPVGYVEPAPGTGAGASVGHEYFTPDGRSIAFAHFPRQFGSGGSIRMIDVETLQETDLGRVHNYSHFCHSPDGRYIVGDEVNESSRADGRLWLFDIFTRQERPLCIHGSSFAPRGNSTQDAHPHPCFAPDGGSVLFTSDRETSPTGHCAVYLASTAGFFDPSPT